MCRPTPLTHTCTCFSVKSPVCPEIDSSQSTFCRVFPIHPCFHTFSQLLQVIDTDDLVDPPDEGGDLDVDAGHVLPAAAEAPADEAGELEVALVLADEGAAAVTLEMKQARFLLRIRCLTASLVSDATFVEQRGT